MISWTKENPDSYFIRLIMKGAKIPDEMWEDLRVKIADEIIKWGSLDENFLDRLKNVCKEFDRSLELEKIEKIYNESFLDAHGLNW